MSTRIAISLPTPSDFTLLRNMVGWGKVTDDQAVATLKHSLSGACLYKADELIGMARVVGDGVFNVYIQDVIVKPYCQKQGLGRMMLKALIAHMAHTLPPSCTVGLMAAAGQDGFYTAFGFKTRPRNGFGAGMSAQLKDLSP